MSKTYHLYKGKYLPDFTAPLLIVTVTDWEKFSRSERFLIQEGKVVEKRAIHHLWKDGYGMELQKKHGDQALIDFEVNGATQIIEAQIRERYKHDHQVAATYCPYRFDEIEDPKNYLIAEQLVGRLPSLKAVTGSRCRELRDLVLEVSRITPIVINVVDDQWVEEDTR
jgi:hypothetical protein